MVDGRFTEEERAHLIPLDAADEARTGSPACSERFREECMRPCHEGRRPRRGRGPSGRARRPRLKRGPCWTHMAGPGSPGSGSPCPGGPAAGTMHASGASGDGWRSRWETRRISLRGGHDACRQARRLLQRSQGAGASGIADPHGACRKARSWQCAEIGVHLNSKILLSAA